MNDVDKQVDPSLRMALVFRSDLPEMTRAKSEIQACHAACELVYAVTISDPKLMEAYLSVNQPKLNMEVDSLEELRAIAVKAQKRGVNYQMIEDAGRTCFAEPTYTCILLGPMSKTQSNALTRDARMRDRERKDI